MNHSTVLQHPPTKGRDATLDVLKGLGIIAMVLGHSGVPFSNFIYLFHMALFFMASGYVWNDKKVANLSSLGKSILSRMRGLWLPYTIANGCFTLLNNLFVTVGIYTPDRRMTLPQMAINLFKNLLMAGDTQMGGASWFLRSLFFVSVGHLLLRYIVVRWKHGKVLFGAVTAIIVVCAEVINRTSVKLPMTIHSCFCGYTAFLLGMLINKLKLKERVGKYIPLAAPVGFGILLLLNPLDNIGMGSGNISSLPFFLAASLSGWFFVWGVSSLLKGPVARFLIYCSKNSIWIVMLHFIAFKPVAWLYLTVTGRDLSGMSDFPVHGAPGLWVAYAVAGTVLPLLMCFGVQKVLALRKK